MCPFGMIFCFYSGFADVYKAFIQSTLEGLVKEVHNIIQAYCREENKTTVPRFYLMCKRLMLSPKVVIQKCLICIIIHEFSNFNTRRSVML